MIYNVVLNSNLRSSGTTSNATYFFDWSVLPECKYKMTALFTSGYTDMTYLVDVAMLEVQLGQSHTYKADVTQTRALTTNCIGNIVPNANTNSTFMYGDSTTLIPISLNRPNTNEFFVKIMTNDIPPVVWDDYVASQLQDYVLILTFETVSD